MVLWIGFNKQSLQIVEKILCGVTNEQKTGERLLELEKKILCGVTNEKKTEEILRIRKKRLTSIYVLLKLRCFV